MSVGPWATFKRRLWNFQRKNTIRLIIAGFTSTFDTICLCRHNSISFSCVIYKSRISKSYLNINIWNLITLISFWWLAKCAEVTWQLASLLSEWQWFWFRRLIQTAAQLVPESDIFEACLDTKKYVMLQIEDYQEGGGAKYRREFERFYSCGVLWKALIFSRCHYACFCLVSLGKHIYLNSALIHFWWNQYAWYRKGIWWLDGVGVRVWSLKEGKNMCHIYTHYLTWQCSVLTTWTGLQNAGSRWGAFCCVNGVSKCEETVG